MRISSRHRGASAPRASRTACSCSTSSSNFCGSSAGSESSASCGSSPVNRFASRARWKHLWEVTLMSQAGRAPASRSRGSSVTRSAQTAWKTSPASSRENPYLMGIEKMSRLYLSISSAQAASSPPTQRFTSAVSEAVRSLLFAVAGPEVMLARRLQVEFIRVPQRVVVEDGGLEISYRILRPDQDMRADQADQRQFFGHDLL